MQFPLESWAHWQARTPTGRGDLSLLEEALEGWPAEQGLGMLRVRPTQRVRSEPWRGNRPCGLCLPQSTSGAEAMLGTVADGPGLSVRAAVRRSSGACDGALRRTHSGGRGAGAVRAGGASAGSRPRGARGRHLTRASLSRREGFANHPPSCGRLPKCPILPAVPSLRVLFFKDTLLHWTVLKLFKKKAVILLP